LPRPSRRRFRGLLKDFPPAAAKPGDCATLGARERSYSRTAEPPQLPCEREAMSLMNKTERPFGSQGSVLVTGAAGFIGSHLCEALVARGERVIGMDNFDPFYDPALKRENIADLLRRPEGPHGGGFELVEGDICDAELVEQTFAQRQLRAVIHLAARAGVRPSIKEPAAYARTNAEGTVVLLEAARRAEVERFVFGSSSSVYGAVNEVPFSEDQPVDRPISPYAASKVAAEGFCYAYHQLYGMPIVCLRFFTVYGPRQRPDLAINKFVRLMLAGQAIPQYGDGSSSRDYTYIEDIVRGVLAAYDSGLEYEIINLGNSSPVGLNEMIQAVGEAVGVQPVIEQLPDQPGDVPRTYASVEKAGRLLGWEPKWTLAEGLRSFVEWYRQREH
jgi:UDP-glucuronate 4-epimerase